MEFRGWSEYGCVRGTKSIRTSVFGLFGESHRVDCFVGGEHVYAEISHGVILTRSGS